MWSPNKPDYDRLQEVHYSMLLLCLGWRKRKRDDHTLSYTDALVKTASESIEVTMRKRRILLSGFVARVGEERLPRRVVFGELFGGKGHSGGQENDWMVRLEEDMMEFGIKFSSKGGERLHRRPADGLDGSRRGQRYSCGNSMTRRAVELLSDTRRPQQRHSPSNFYAAGGRFLRRFRSQIRIFYRIFVVTIIF